MAHAFITSTWETEAGRSLGEASLVYREREFQDSQSYKEKPCLKVPQPEKKQERVIETVETTLLSGAGIKVPEIILFSFRAE